MSTSGPRSTAPPHLTLAGPKLSRTPTPNPNQVYYPAASLFKAASVTFNFGPAFDFPPADCDARPICELATPAAAAAATPADASAAAPAAASAAAPAAASEGTAAAAAAAPAPAPAADAQSAAAPTAEPTGA